MMTPSILKAEAATCGGVVGRHSVVQRDRSRRIHTIAAYCFQAVSIRFHRYTNAITAVLKYTRHAEFFTTVIFRAHQMVRGFFPLRATLPWAAAPEKMKGLGWRLFTPEPRCPKSPWGAPMGRRQSSVSGKFELKLRLRPTGLSSPVYRDSADYIALDDGLRRIYEDQHGRPELRWYWSKPSALRVLSNH
jgi:hypothetical protein